MILSLESTTLPYLYNNYIDLNRILHYIKIKWYVEGAILILSIYWTILSICTTEKKYYNN